MFYEVEGWGMPQGENLSLQFGIYNLFAKLHINIYHIPTGLDKDKFSAYNCKYFLTNSF